jgi:hypothetical protein
MRQSWEDSRDWAKPAHSLLEQIIQNSELTRGSCFNATQDQDMHEVTDITYSCGPLKFSVRVRDWSTHKNSYSGGVPYTQQFTIRSKVVGGGETEIDKILQGKGSYFIYAWWDREQTIPLYTIIDLSVFRQVIKSRKDCSREKDFWDGTAMYIFNFHDFPSSLIVEQGQWPKEVERVKMRGFF